MLNIVTSRISTWNNAEAAIQRTKLERRLIWNCQALANPGCMQLLCNSNLSSQVVTRTLTSELLELDISSSLSRQKQEAVSTISNRLSMATFIDCQTAVSHQKSEMDSCQAQTCVGYHGPLIIQIRSSRKPPLRAEAWHARAEVDWLHAWRMRIPSFASYVIKICRRVALHPSSWSAMVFAIHWGVISDTCKARYV